jgi:cysteine desulfurase
MCSLPGLEQPTRGKYDMQPNTHQKSVETQQRFNDPDMFDIRDSEIYLDNAATTAIDLDVVAAMQPYLEERYGNPQTAYHLGREAKDAIEAARSSVADMLDCKPSEIYFTSGGTESNNWAIKGFQYGDRKRLVVSAVEHLSILEPAKWMRRNNLLGDVAEVPVDENGLVKMTMLDAYLKTGMVGLVSIQYANNETGTIQPVAEIAQLCKSNGAIFHCDAVQAFGKVDFDVADTGADMMTLSAHKIHGPMGIGALYVKEGTPLEPLLHGGGHENGMRSGTHAVPQIVGFGKAVEVAWSNIRTEMTRVSELVDRFSADLSHKAQAKRNGHATKRLPNILNITIPADASLVCGILAKNGICVSMGSACRSGKEPHVLKAMGRPYGDCVSSLRISMSKYTTDKQMMVFAARLQAAIAESKKRSAV